tara:strand:+ start:987 stop:1292 length:306 start_codon:yes stop_codon:yes gene_type:complete
VINRISINDINNLSGLSKLIPRKKAKSKITIILSAIGSKTFPILLSVLNFLAKYPSKKSVKIMKKKIIKPKYLPEKDWSMIKYNINTGAANSLRKVRKFGI